MASEESSYLEPRTLPTADTPPTPEDADPYDPAQGSLEDRLRAALGEDYELGPQIGRGGMGIVFRATDKRLKREVAIKVLPPEVTYRPDLRKRFVREAQVAASLTHPNIVPIYDVGNAKGLVWFVMALVSGETVRDLVRRLGPQPFALVLRVMRETAWALSYAHARGVVHRDIKPDNIMIDRASGRSIVTDFGLAKLHTEDHTVLTSAGGVIGTPSYMSPEQARGEEEVDHRTDIYSLGLVSYYMIAGRNPFQARSQQAALARVLTEQPPDILTARPDLPQWFGDAYARSAQRDRERRYETAEALANELDKGDTVAPTPTSVENFLSVVQGYFELSILASVMLLFIGIPRMPVGAVLGIAAMLAIPFLNTIHLMNAEGLGWPEIRTALVARRTHWLRTLSLSREAGFNWPLVILIVVAFSGLAFVRFWSHYNMYQSPGDLFTWPSPVWSMDTFDANDSFAYAPKWPQERYPVPVRRPAFLWVYAIAASVVWGRVFGLQMRRMTPARLDAVTSWRLPATIDRLGQILFAKISAPGRIIQATAEFGELSEPAVQAALAFNRVRRSLGFVNRWRLWRPVRLGTLVARRLWLTHNRWGALRARYNSLPADRRPEALEQAIEKRESVISECIGTLESLRQILEDSVSPMSMGMKAEKHAIDEARRLTRGMRRVMWLNRLFLVICLAWVALITDIRLDGQTYSIGFVESFGPAREIIGKVLTYALLFVFIPFQFVKNRLYT